MAIALKRVAGTGQLQQIQAGDSLEADSFERLSGSGNLIVGSLIGTDELRLGSLTGLTRAMNDLHVDGDLDMEAGDILDAGDINMDGPLVGRSFTTISPTAIAAQQNNYDPTGFDTADIVLVTLTGDQTITGFAAPAAGENHEVLVVNDDGGSDELTIADQSTSSTTTNRVICPDGEDLVLKPGEAAKLIYDDDPSRWRAYPQHVHDYDDFVSATGSNSITNSSSFTQISSMTLTPPAGTYFVKFSADVDPPSSAGRIAIFVGGVGGTKDADSERDVSGFGRSPCQTQGRVAVNGSQAIVVGYNGSFSATFYERSLAIRRVRP